MCAALVYCCTAPLLRALQFMLKAVSLFHTAANSIANTPASDAAPPVPLMPAYAQELGGVQPTTEQQVSQSPQFPLFRDEAAAPLVATGASQEGGAHVDAAVADDRSLAQSASQMFPPASQLPDSQEATNLAVNAFNALLSSQGDLTTGLSQLLGSQPDIAPSQPLSQVFATQQEANNTS